VQQLGLILKQHAADLHQVWLAVLREPPFRLPPGHDLDALPGVLYDLIEVSLLRPHDIGAHELKVAAALNHGEKCRRRGYEEQIVYEEFAALREAIRRYVGTCDTPRATAREALIRLDMAISVAEQAAIRGYHRDMYVQLGKWEGIVSQLAKQSPLLGFAQP
jgi:hypothetical protein